MGLVHPDRDDGSGRRREDRDGPDRGADTDRVREHAREDRPDRVPGVAPQPVHADRRGSPRRMRHVADGASSVG
jgi:hypothetical protein